MDDNITYGSGVDVEGKTSDKDAVSFLKSFRYCTNSKCSWQGPRYRTMKDDCPICGTETKQLQSNDGFSMVGPPSYIFKDVKKVSIYQGI